jgi:hypothetical protein
MKIELWKNSDVTPYPGNPRLNDDAVDVVAASLKEFGFRQPIVVDGEGVIVCGHTRYKAAVEPIGESGDVNPRVLSTTTSACSASTRTTCRPRRTRPSPSRAICGSSTTTACSAATEASPKTWTAFSAGQASTWSTPTRRTT